MFSKIWISRWYRNYCVRLPCKPYERLLRQVLDNFPLRVQAACDIATARPDFAFRYPHLFPREAIRKLATQYPLEASRLAPGYISRKQLLLNRDQLVPGLLSLHGRESEILERAIELAPAYIRKPASSRAYCALWQLNQRALNVLFGAGVIRVEVVQPILRRMLMDKLAIGSHDHDALFDIAPYLTGIARRSFWIAAVRTYARGYQLAFEAIRVGRRAIRDVCDLLLTCGWSLLQDFITTRAIIHVLPPAMIYRIIDRAMYDLGLQDALARHLRIGRLRRYQQALTCTSVIRSLRAIPG